MVSIQKDEVPRMRSQSTDEASYIAKRDILNRLASNEKVRADKTSIFSYVSQVARQNRTGKLEMWDITELLQVPRGHCESGAHKYLCSYFEGLHRNPRSGMVILHESHTSYCIPLPNAGGESPEGKKGPGSSILRCVPSLRVLGPNRSWS